MTERHGGSGGNDDSGHPARRVSDESPPDDAGASDGTGTGSSGGAATGGHSNLSTSTGGTRRGTSPAGTDGGSSGRRSWLIHLYDMATSAGGVLLVGLLIVAVSGVWPPLVAIESGSMEPHIQEGDLVFVMDEQRFSGPESKLNTGVVTAYTGSRNGYSSFSGPGDVIVYQPGGDESATPIIHRAEFWVVEGENWYHRANDRYLGTADNCEELDHCPAPHDGFVTKGDSNTAYDQASAGKEWAPVKPEWVIGTAEQRVPLVGRLRLNTRSVLTGPSAAETRGLSASTNATVASVAARP